MTCLSSLKAFTLRIGAVSFLVLVLFGAANAYIIVKRDGRRIEIPSQFVVTSTTLTYEVSPGIQITMQLRTIDIAATERANNEAPGTFLRRAQAPPLPPEEYQSDYVAPPSNQTTAVRTITNADLQATRARREQSEVAYGKRVRQLGLPSLAESRERAAADSETIQRELADSVASKREEESYWRGRASQLRTEMAALDAEIGFVRGRLDELPATDWPNGYTIVTEAPYILGDRGRWGNYPGRRNRRNGVWIGNGPYGQNGGNGPWWPGVIGSPFPTYDHSYERNELITRFNDLAAKRAGMSARWRALEAEARRAGAPPGWLRE